MTQIILLCCSVEKMFAKLKEKIQKEGGSVNEGDRTLTPLPGHASPRKGSVTGKTMALGKGLFFNQKVLIFFLCLHENFLWYSLEVPL